MQKIKFNVEKEVNSNKLTYVLEPTDVVDERALQRFNKDTAPGIAEFKYSDENGVRKVTSEVPDYPKLGSFIKKNLSKAEVIKILKNLMASYSIGNQGIPVHTVIKDTDYIFVNSETCETVSVLVPVKQEGAKVSEVSSFLRELISKMRFNPDDKDNYVARLLTELNVDQFEYGRFNGLLDAMLLMAEPKQQVPPITANASLNQPHPDMNRVPEQQPVNNSSQGSVKINRMAVMMNRAAQTPDMGQSMAQPNQPMPGMGMGQPVAQPIPQPGQPASGMGMGQTMPQPGQPTPGMGVSQPASQPGQPTSGMGMGQPAPQPGQPAPGMGMGQPAPQPGQPATGMGMNQSMPASGFTNNNGQIFKPTPEPVKAPEQPVAPEPVKTPEQPVAPEPAKAPEQPVAPEPAKAPEQPVAPEPAKAPEQPVAPEPVKAPEQPVFSEKAPQILPEEQPKAPTVNAETGRPAIQSGLDFEQTTIIRDYDKTEPLQGESIENQLRMAFGSASKPARELAATGSTDVLSDNYDSNLPEPNFVRERTGERFFITKPEFKIGKSRLHADYAIDGNTAISRIHCLVVQKNGVNYIKDNASTNGTFVDENKVNAGEEVLLKDGVTVRLGDEIFTFHLKRR